jgi:hypothetical protein
MAMVDAQAMLSAIQALVKTGYAAATHSAEDIFTDAYESLDTVQAFHNAMADLEGATMEGSRVLREAGWPTDPEVDSEQTVEVVGFVLAGMAAAREFDRQQMPRQTVEVQPTIDPKLAALRAAVLARCTYWDALRALELATVGEEGFADRANDEVIEHIGTLAAGMGSADASDVIDEHVAALDAIIKKHS